MPIYVESVVRTLTAKDRSAKFLGSQLVLIEVVAHLSHNISVRRDWLLEVGNKPPLDLVLHHTHGQFLELSFFISHEQVPVAGKRTASTITVGEPVFNMQAWDAIEGYDQYLRESGGFQIALADGDMELTLMRERPVRVVDSGEIRFWMGEQGKLVGLALPNIDKSMIELLHDAGVLDTSSKISARQSTIVPVDESPP